MGSGGSGGSGAGGSSGGYNSNGWGGTMGSGGNAYSGGGVGGIGTAGTMSGGAGGSAMGGFGNTGAGGSGMAGISTHSGETPAGFTPSAGDPRGTSLGMDAFGNYKGAPGYAGIGSASANRATTMTPKAQMEMFGYVKYPSNPPKNPTVFRTSIPTQTQALSWTDTVAPYVAATPNPYSAQYGVNPFTRSPMSGGLLGLQYGMGNQGTIGPQVGVSGAPYRGGSLGGMGMAGSPAGVGSPGGNYTGVNRTSGTALSGTGGYSGNFSSMGGRAPFR